MSGLLSIVATPIGNLDDLSPRAAAALGKADLIACEDTRVTRKLLSRVTTTARLISYRSANEARKATELADQIERGTRVALVTDAGTPGISDPGYPLIEECFNRGLTVEIIPGPSAAIAALVVSGLPTARFVFEGFLPHARRGRIDRLRTIASEQRTLVLFEAPHRIAATLTDMLEVLGDRRIAMAREMTKLHEEVLRTTIANLRDRLAQATPKGEITLVVEGAPEPQIMQRSEQEVAALLDARIGEGSSVRDAVAAVAKETGEPKNRVYRIANR